MSDYLDEYQRCAEPDKREKGYSWQTAIGLQAVDGLETSEYLHEMVVREIKKLREVYQPTTEMQEVWDKSHARYVEGVAFIKKMLEM